MELANKYGVPYEEIMGWFCQHFGFGEIDLAYGWSVEYAEYGVLPADLFAMKSSGMGWGQVRQYLEDPTGREALNRTTPASLINLASPTPKNGEGD
jgi:hypothetical protein